jgi:hypothetical protein
MTIIASLINLIKISSLFYFVCEREEGGGGERERERERE